MGYIFIHDTRDKPDKHQNIDRYMAEQGHRMIRSKLYVGDIALLHDQSVCIDIKQDLPELCGNVTQQHRRFVAELDRAKEAEIRLIILCEHGGDVRCLEDVARWQNPRRKFSPKATNGDRLYKILRSLEVRHGCEFVFCTKADCGKTIVELLCDHGK